MHYLTRSILKATPRKKNSHKGDNGRVLIVAGSEDYSGAATLTALACESVLRSGADICVACCPSKIAWLVNNKIPDAITKKFPGKELIFLKL